MNYLDIKPEVKEALEQGKAVVALESTIIAHGMPYPKNVETALAVEDVIRANGAVPATIAIIGGVIKVGLTPEEIEYLGTAEGVLKVWRAQPAQGVPGAEPGVILKADRKQGLIVATADGAMELCEIQAPNAKRMDAKAFLLCHPIEDGKLLSEVCI